MINFIVGQNTIGKTLELTRKVRECKKNNAVLTNLIEDDSLKLEKYNVDRVEALKDLLFPDEDVLISKEKLSIGSSDPDIIVKGHGAKLEELLTLICRNRGFLFLDEPDKELNYSDKMLLVNFLSRVESTFNTIWIVTHYEGFLFVDNKEVYTVKMDETSSATTLERVLEGKEFEVID